MQGVAGIAEAARDLGGGQLRELAHAREAPAGERLDGGGVGVELRERQRREERGLAAVGDDDGGVGQRGRDARGELA